MAGGGKTVVAVACALLVWSAGAQHLDQHTDESGSNRNLPQGSMWQAWRAGWSSNLTHLDLLLGSTFPCETMQGQLLVRAGQPESMSEALDASTALLVQEVKTTCRGDSFFSADACTNGDCMAWHSFGLEQPVPVVQDQVYTFVLTGMTSRDLLRTARVGVSPAAEDMGGASSLLVTPKYATKYTQYTFRTRMLSKRSDTPSLESNGENPASKGHSTSSSVSLAGVVLPVVLVALLALVVVGALVVRRRGNHYAVANLADGKSLPSTSRGADSISMQSMGSSVAPRRLANGRYPIHVASRDQQAASEADTWADNVSVRTTEFYGEAPLSDTFSTASSFAYINMQASAVEI